MNFLVKELSFCYFIVQITINSEFCCFLLRHYPILINFIFHTFYLLGDIKSIVEWLVYRALQFLTHAY